jgi:sialidase-1
MVERTDGTILLNSRSFRGARVRKIATSTDGGETWSPLVDEPQLYEPMCMGSIFRFSDPLDGERSVILFSSPASQEERTAGTIRLSYDEGKTWPVSRVLVREGQFAYSCLTRLADGRVGCLYETDDYGRIVFARFPVEWLESGAAE